MLYTEIRRAKRCERREATFAAVIECILCNIVRCPGEKRKAAFSIKGFGCSERDNLRWCQVYAQDDLIVGLVSVRGCYC